MSKTVLCFGDSNLWGWNPESESQYTLDQRWINIFSKNLESN